MLMTMVMRVMVVVVVVMHGDDDDDDAENDDDDNDDENDDGDGKEDDDGNDDDVGNNDNDDNDNGDGGYVIIAMIVPELLDVEEPGIVFCTEVFWRINAEHMTWTKYIVMGGARNLCASQTNSRRETYVGLFRVE